MKKRNIALILISILIIIAIVIIGIYAIIENGKNYKIEQIKEYNYFVLKQNDLYGVIDRKGNIVIQAQYNEVKIPNPQKAVFVCSQEENIKVLNEKNEEILTQYNEVTPIRLKNIASDLMYEKSVLKYKKDDKYGLINFEGKEIVKPIYDEIDSLPYKEGELLVKQDDKYGAINIKGNKLIKIQYDNIEVDEYYTDEARCKYAGYIVTIKTEEGYRYGYLNYEGRNILDTEYNEISRVNDIIDNNNSYIICAKNGQYGVTKNKEKLLGNEYQSIRYDINNKVFVIEKSKKYGISNLEGKEIVPVQYNQIDITGIYLYAQDEQGITVYNNNGTQANINSNVSILNTSNEKYKIRINNENETKYGVINKKGEQLVEEKYNYIDYLYEDYFIVSQEDGKLGIIDDNENVKIEINKDILQKIQDTDLVQAVENQNRITQIYSKEMKKLCEMQNAIVEVQDDIIKVYNELEIRYFTREGEELTNIQVYSNNKLFVKLENNKYGFLDVNGKVVVDYNYDKAYEFNEYGFASVKKDGKWGVIDENGKEVIEPIYELEGQREPSFIGKYYKVIYGFGEFYYTDAK